MLRQPVHKYYYCLLCCTQKKLQPCYLSYIWNFSYYVFKGLQVLHCWSWCNVNISSQASLHTSYADLLYWIMLYVCLTNERTYGWIWRLCLLCRLHPAVWLVERGSDLVWDAGGTATLPGPNAYRDSDQGQWKRKNTVHFDRNWLQWGSCLKDRCHSSCITDMAGHYLPDWGHRPQCLFLLDVESFDSIHRRLLTLLYSWIRKRRTHFIQQLSTNTSSVCVLPKQEISCRKQNKPSTRKINYNWHKCLMYIICYIHYTIYGYILSIKTYISIIKVNIKKWPHGSCCLPPPVLLSCFLPLWLTSIADNG